MKFINSAALNKIRRAASKCHSVLTKRCAFRRRAKVAVDSVDRRSSAGKLSQVSGPETAKFQRTLSIRLGLYALLKRGLLLLLNLHFSTASEMAYLAELKSTKNKFTF